QAAKPQSLWFNASIKSASHQAAKPQSLCFNASIKSASHLAAKPQSLCFNASIKSASHLAAKPQLVTPKSFESGPPSIRRQSHGAELSADAVYQIMRRRMNVVEGVVEPELLP